MSTSMSVGIHTRTGTPLTVVRAAVLGQCFGVRDALEVAFAREDADEVTIYGELVHNRVVQNRLEEAGFRTVSELDRTPNLPTEKVLVTAHGLSNREAARLREAGHELIDTTCPLVRRVHNAALRLREGGFFPIVIGIHGHVEVLGLVGDLDEYEVVTSVAEAEALHLDRAKLGVVIQTTFAESDALVIVEALKRANPNAEVRFYNTVCEPTRQRRQAVSDLAESVDVVVIVGGANSNNSHQLLKIAEEAGTKAFLVLGPDDLRPEWFVGHQVIGISAGTSTLDELVDAVESAILALR